MRRKAASSSSSCRLVKVVRLRFVFSPPGGAASAVPANEGDLWRTKKESAQSTSMTSRAPARAHAGRPRKVSAHTDCNRYISCFKLANWPDHPRRRSPLKFFMRSRVRELAIYFEFHENRSRGLGAVSGLKQTVSINLAHGLYNSLYKPWSYFKPANRARFFSQ